MKRNALVLLSLASLSLAPLTACGVDSGPDPVSETCGFWDAAPEASPAQMCRVEWHPSWFADQVTDERDAQAVVGPVILRDDVSGSPARAVLAVSADGECLVLDCLD